MKTVVRNLLAPASCVFVAFTLQGCKDEEETPPEDTVTPAAQIELKKKQAEQAHQERLKQSGDIFDDFMKTYVSAEQEFGKAQSHETCTQLAFWLSKQIAKYTPTVNFMFGDVSTQLGYDLIYSSSTGPPPGTKEQWEEYQKKQKAANDAAAACFKKHPAPAATPASPGTTVQTQVDLSTDPIAQIYQQGIDRLKKRDGEGGAPAIFQDCYDIVSDTTQKAQQKSAEKYIEAMKTSRIVQWQNQGNAVQVKAVELNSAFENDCATRFAAPDANPAGPESMAFGIYTVVTGRNKRQRSDGVLFTPLPTLDPIQAAFRRGANALQTVPSSQVQRCYAEEQKTNNEANVQFKDYREWLSHRAANGPAQVQGFYQARFGAIQAAQIAFEEQSKACRERNGFPQPPAGGQPAAGNGANNGANGGINIQVNQPPLPQAPVVGGGNALQTGFFLEVGSDTHRSTRKRSHSTIGLDDEHGGSGHSRTRGDNDVIQTAHWM